MATYAELAELQTLDQNQLLRDKVAVATLLCADAFRTKVDDGTKTVAEQKRYAQRIFNTVFASQLVFRKDGSAVALSGPFEAVYRLVISANPTATKAQIENASDAAIQAAVDDACVFLAASFPDPAIP